MSGPVRPHILDDPVSAGVRRAAERLERHGLPSPASVEFRHAIATARALLERHDASARAAELFVENVAIASAMREHYDETPLSPADITHYFDMAVWFFNSFWHE
jgi:hypothetical protein